MAERRGSGLQSRIHGFESRTHLGENHVFRLLSDAWAIGAAVARFPDTEEVTGSIPVSPTSIHTKGVAMFAIGLPELGVALVLVALLVWLLLRRRAR